MQGPRETRPQRPSPKQKPLCATPPKPKAALSATVMNDPGRARAIIMGRSKWANKTLLHYAFFADGHYAVPPEQADVVREAFHQWKDVGIGLDFQEVADLSEAEVRIGFSLADASSASAVGRDVLTVPLDQPTTVYGWDLTSIYGHGTALHELGHVLGMEHEHQSPFAGIQWHEDAVYASLGGPPNNWPRDTIFHNILEKLDPQQVSGSPWDPDSIMEYEFEPGLIAVPEQYDKDGLTPPGTLSDADKAWVRQWYPGEAAATTHELQPFRSIAMNLKAGQQVDAQFEPPQSRSYTFASQGATDTLLTLFEEIDGQPRYLAGDDDSGQERQASLRYKLFKGRKYFVRLRLVHPGRTGTTSLSAA